MSKIKFVEEMPDKRILEKDSIYLQYDKGYNHCHGDFQPYIKWQNERIAELEAEIKRLSGVFRTRRLRGKKFISKIEKSFKAETGE